jgi:hypothetical protein
VALFEKLRCPYFVNFVGASHVPGKQCICTELVTRGSVAQVIKSSRIATALKAKMALDAAEALTFLHENGVIYRDLKLDNLLVVSVSVTASVNCKLGDFGTALTVKEPYTLAQHSVGIGTPIYMAPELLVGRKSTGYNVQVDIYALAISLWEMSRRAAAVRRREAHVGPAESGGEWRASAAERRVASRGAQRDRARLAQLSRRQPAQGERDGAAVALGVPEAAGRLSEHRRMRRKSRANLPTRAL